MEKSPSFSESLPIRPLKAPINGQVKVPGSKSITNRALMLAALANGSTTLYNALFSDDTMIFADALENLGFTVDRDPECKQIRVTGSGGIIPAKNAEVNVGNAGTAARFLTALLALGNGNYILDGNSRMRERPIGDLVTALNQLGARIESINVSSSITSLPIKINGTGIRGGKTKISGKKSSQFLSALLMAASYANKPVEIEVVDELNSQPYITLTQKIMADFGIEIENEYYQLFTINPGQYVAKSKYVIEPDASSASYFFAAPAICGGACTVENFTHASMQGDIGFLEVLSNMGCTVEEKTNSVTVTGPQALKGLDIDMRHIPDTAQTLAVVAPFADSPTRIRGIASARMKETDRISAVSNELRRIGVKVDEHNDGMTIHPSQNMHGGSICTYNDHRMAMSFALVGLRIDEIVIENPACVSKTFPNYFDVLEDLR
jgi:3-phosphoshikimate 1-carboxyvinyltransferase